MRITAMDAQKSSQSGAPTAQVSLPLATDGFPVAADTCGVEREEDSDEDCHRCEYRESVWCDGHQRLTLVTPSMFAIVREDATKRMEKAKLLLSEVSGPLNRSRR